MNTSQNRFILAHAASLLVTAYKECIAEYQTVLPLNLSIGHDAPDSYAALRSQAAQGQLKVSTAHNASSIYGASGNLTFRIFHDYGHLLYDAEFTTEQEVSLALTQWRDLIRYIPQEWQGICYVVYRADTVAQSEYEAIHKDFPVDQKAFVLDILNKHFEAEPR
ncbi:conserved hypothetical protein [Pseudomonas phage phiIBB-PF7A]|uniref:Uncharacterized protein n=1 Tax=Pseudomonas phage phiIBB-PF7A TaxID=942165 RepID=E9KII3_9CAUD|nr:hypothetical protein phiIBB-PF7Ap43 [Pseudomonas phage phiIBB-PF7A]ADV35708.1 conserved hypothetical protein [Pseudomonas phage phiIBB-PF7A]